jgi:hypothetical protein
MEDEALPTPWNCPSCGAKNSQQPDNPASCAQCGWKPAPEARSASPFWYLVVGMAPAPLMLSLMTFKNLGDWIPLLFLTIGIIGSVTAGFGLMSRANKPILRSIGGIALSVVFFVFNVMTVIAAGCSGMGRIGG